MDDQVACNINLRIKMQVCFSKQDNENLGMSEWGRMWRLTNVILPTRYIPVNAAQEKPSKEL